MKFTFAIGLLACLSVVKGEAQDLNAALNFRGVSISKDLFLSWIPYSQLEGLDIYNNPSTGNAIAVGDYMCSKEEALEPEKFQVTKEVTVAIDATLEHAHNPYNARGSFNYHCYFTSTGIANFNPIHTFFPKGAKLSFWRYEAKEIAWARYADEKGETKAYEQYKEINNDITLEDFKKFLEPGKTFLLQRSEIYKPHPSMDLEQRNELTTGQKPTTHPSSE
ncbi:hypothetical protein IWQ61_009892 [Dispira simplex]|nr:hypothetical protein IWQ61_009892 [Dispira simplex]